MTYSFCLVMLTISCVEMRAQSLNDILSSSAVKDAITAVTGGKSVTATNLVGTWSYVNPAVALESNNVLKNVTGSVASAEVEKKLNAYCEKVGLKEGALVYTFNADSTFSCLYKKKTIAGTYSLNQSAKTVTLKFGKNLSLNTFTAHVLLGSGKLDLLFNVDKLFSLLDKLSTMTNNSTLKLANSLASQYDSIKVGLELKKQ